MFKNYLRRIVFSCLVTTLVFGSFSELRAQDTPWDDADRAAMAFDIDVKAFNDSPLATVDDEYILDQLGKSLKIDIAKVTRFHGAFKFPKDMETLEAEMENPFNGFPVSFILKVEFTERAAFEEAFAQYLEMEKKTINGKEFYSPQNVGDVFFHMADDHFVAGTENYIFREDGKSVFSERLQTAMKALPETRMIRTAIDAAGSRGFLNSLALARNLPGDTAMASLLSIAGYLKDVDQIAVTLDPLEETLLSISSQSESEEAAKSFNGNINQVFSAAKFGFLMMKSEAGANFADEMATAQTIVNQLDLKLNGTGNTVVVTQPDGFSKTLSATLYRFQQAAFRTVRLNNLRQVGLSALNYESAFREFPFHDDRINEGKVSSWRVVILPFLEQNNMFDAMESMSVEEARKKFADQMPEVFGSDGRNSNICWIQSKVKGFVDITDGSSNTIMLIEFPKGRPWLESTPPTIEETVVMFEALEDDDDLLVCFYDCSVQTIKGSVDKETFRAMLTPRGGEVIDR